MSFNKLFFFTKNGPISLFLKYCTSSCEEEKNDLYTMSQPTIRREGERDSRVCLPRKKNAQSHHQCLLEENVRKTKKGSTKVKNKGSKVVYMQGRY